MLNIVILIQTGGDIKSFGVIFRFSSLTNVNSKKKVLLWKVSHRLSHLLLSQDSALVFSIECD